MPTHLALLRGINLGGHKKVAMAELRDIVTGLGHTGVATYIQSGNVLFSTTETDNAALARGIEDAVASRLGVQSRVLVLSQAELAQVAQDNPYPGELNPRFVHAVFLPSRPSPEMIADVAQLVGQVAARGSRDEARYVGQALFVHTPDGYGRSELAALLAKARGPLSARGAGTARNWATVTKLLQLCQDPG
jgi:uncharacterized protein (DUF1697 family)